MNHEQLRAYCLQKTGSSADFPFDEHTEVFRVMGKMFALTNLTWDTVAVNLKCDPDWSMLLRQHYDAVKPGYHMNKKHWNTVTFDGTIPDEEIREMIDHSYRLVAKSLKKVDRNRLNALEQSNSEV